MSGLPVVMGCMISLTFLAGGCSSAGYRADGSGSGGGVESRNLPKAKVNMPSAPVSPAPQLSSAVQGTHGPVQVVVYHPWAPALAGRVFDGWAKFFPKESRPIPEPRSGSIPTSSIAPPEEQAIVILRGRSDVREYAARGLLAPLDGTLARLPQDTLADLALAVGEPEKRLAAVIEQQIQFKGKYYAVPLGLHRTNLIWFSPKNLERIGIHGFEGASSLDEFLKVLDRAKSAGVVPLFLSTEDRLAAHLLDMILYAEGGKDFYERYWDTFAGADQPEFRKALNTFLRLKDFANQDHASLGLEEGLRLLMRGEIAFVVTGDWVKGSLQASGWRPMPEGGVDQSQYSEVDFYAHPFLSSQETRGYSLGVVEAAGISGGTGEGRTKVVEALQALSSPNGQIVLAEAAGTLPTRRVSSLPDKIALENLWDLVKWAPTEFVPSGLYGGQAAEREAINAWVDIVNQLVADGDIDLARQQFQALARQRSTMN